MLNGERARLAEREGDMRSFTRRLGESMPRGRKATRVLYRRIDRPSRDKVYFERVVVNNTKYANSTFPSLEMRVKRNVPRRTIHTVDARETITYPDYVY